MLLLCFIQVNAQIVETVATHSKIKDGLYVDDLGNVYTTSGGLQNGNEIGKYDIASGTFDFAHLTGVFGPIDIDEKSDGLFVVTNYDNNTVSTIDTATNQVTIIATGLDGPAGIAIDDTDNIYVSNFGAPPTYSGHQIHKITSSGVSYVLVDDPVLFRFQAIVFNDQGELIVSSQNKFYKVDPVTGAIQLWVDLGIGFGHMVFRQQDSSIYGTSAADDKIYRIDASGQATVFAGTTAGYQDGDVSVAQFNNPLGIELSPDENIMYVSESTRLRRIIIDPSLNTEEFNAGSIAMYPNPAEDLLSIKTEKEIQLVRIFTLQGSLVKETQHTEIDVSQLSNGIYFVQLSIDGQTFIKRFIKK